MQLGAMSSVAFCASMPCPLSHFAPGCPFLQSRDAPGSHVLCPQDATGSPVLCRILRMGALPAVASCAWVPCPLSHLGSGCPVPSRKMRILIRHQMAYQIDQMLRVFDPTSDRLSNPSESLRRPTSDGLSTIQVFWHRMGYQILKTPLGMGWSSHPTSLALECALAALMLPSPSLTTYHPHTRSTGDWVPCSSISWDFSTTSTRNASK